MHPKPQLLHTAPWVSRPGIAPRAWQDGPRLWLESNGSDGCYGGWELVFSVPPGSVPPDVVMRFEIEAAAERLARGPDELVVEAFWHAPDGTEVDWDPVGVSAVTLGENGATVRFATRLGHPPVATRLSVRCGLRWSPRGRVAWHSWQPTPPRRRLRLGTASARPARWIDADTNAAHYVAQCRLAGEVGVDLVCLPELILAIGTPEPFDPDRVHAAALPVPGLWLAPFQDVARAYHMGICFSVYERAGTAGEIVYNTAVLLGRDGAVVGTQRKVHLALREARAGVAAGHELAVQTFDGVTLGMAICMDSTPPETARVLARQGAEILLVPTEGDFRATPWSRGTTELHEPRWKAIHVAHALDNHLYVVVARNDTLGSAIVAPSGELLAYNTGDRALLWADVDLDALGSHPLGASVKEVLWSMRRPHAYRTLASWP